MEDYYQRALPGKMEVFMKYNAFLILEELPVLRQAEQEQGTHAL